MLMFHVCFISPGPLERFWNNLAQIFTITKWSAERKFHTRMFKVNVTLGGGMSNAYISCPLHTTWTTGDRLWGRHIVCSRDVCQRVSLISHEPPVGFWNNNLAKYSPSQGDVQSSDFRHSMWRWYLSDAYLFDHLSDYETSYTTFHSQFHFLGPPSRYQCR